MDEHIKLMVQKWFSAAIEFGQGRKSFTELAEVTGDVRKELGMHGFLSRNIAVHTGFHAAKSMAGVFGHNGKLTPGAINLLDRALLTGNNDDAFHHLVRHDCNDILGVAVREEITSQLSATEILSIITGGINKRRNDLGFTHAQMALG